MLANSTLDMLQLLTADIVDPFLRPEVIDRLAAMLCFNIVQLTGPKCSNLKVRNPEKYHWEPRQVLSMLVGTLLNMGRREEFVKAISRDTRSFSPAVFARAAAILEKHSIRPASDITRFNRLTDRIQKMVESTGKEEEDLGEIPDEFLDPLMFTLMEDPVKIATSGVTVDRSTIVAHLLNDPHDPFNRMPLTMEQVHPDKELYQRILAFKQSKKQ